MLSFLNSLTLRKYSEKDTFEVVNKIRFVLPELFEQEYHY